jgi:hypothetical protein
VEKTTKGSMKSTVKPEKGEWAISSGTGVI